MASAVARRDQAQIDPDVAIDVHQITRMIDAIATYEKHAAFFDVQRITQTVSSGTSKGMIVTFFGVDWNEVDW